MRIQLLIILFLTTNSALFGDRTYLEFGVSSEIWDDFNLTLAPEWRTDPDKDEEQYHTDLSLEYALTKRWDIGIGYRYGRISGDDEPEVDFDRYSASTSYTVKIEDFRVQFRIRYLNGTDDDAEQSESMRYRVKFSNDLDFLNLRPFVAYERRELVNTTEDKDRDVLSGGLSWRIHKQHTLTAEYQWVDKLYSTNDYGVVKISYNFEF